MTLVQVTLALSGLGVLVTAVLSVLFLRDPIGGLATTTHRAEKLPEVMTDRYIAFTFLAIGATLYQDLNVIAVLFGAFAFMGFADAYIYARGGHPYKKHLAAGVAASVVVVVACMAMSTRVEGTI
ncbi:MAG: hypothetical protein AAFW87_11415 [Pseudomonadota bacterium]